MGDTKKKDISCKVFIKTIKEYQATNTLSTRTARNSATKGSVQLSAPGGGDVSLGRGRGRGNGSARGGCND